MSRVEVLVATVDKDSHDLYERMKIESDFVVANQAGKYEYDEYLVDGCNVRSLTTDTRGVGTNRNLALELSRGEILLFSDDDVVYSPGYADRIANAFDEYPDADVLIFRMNMIRNGELIMEDHYNVSRRHLWNGLSYGACKIAIRKKSLERAHLRFTTLFGGGCMYYCGEDSMFLVDCFKNKLKVYTSDVFIGYTDCSTSSWFEGYNEKYFYDKGAWCAAAFDCRFMQLLMIFHLMITTRKSEDMSRFKILKLLLAGRKGFAGLHSYNSK